jgi:hypothetical protein
MQLGGGVLTAFLAYVATVYAIDRRDKEETAIILGVLCIPLLSRSRDRRGTPITAAAAAMVASRRTPQNALAPGLISALQ